MLNTRWRYVLAVVLVVGGVVGVVYGRESVLEVFSGILFVLSGIMVFRGSSHWVMPVFAAWGTHSLGDGAPTGRAFGAAMLLITLIWLVVLLKEGFAVRRHLETASLE